MVKQTPKDTVKLKYVFLLLFITLKMECLCQTTNADSYISLGRNDAFEI
jgi:hypothetical protein